MFFQCKVGAAESKKSSVSKILLLKVKVKTASPHLIAVGSSPPSMKENHVDQSISCIFCFLIFTRREIKTLNSNRSCSRTERNVTVSPVFPGSSGHPALPPLAPFDWSAGRPSGRLRDASVSSSARTERLCVLQLTCCWVCEAEFSSSVNNQHRPAAASSM